MQINVTVNEYLYEQTVDYFKGTYSNIVNTEVDNNIITTLLLLTLGSKFKVKEISMLDIKKDILIPYSHLKKEQTIKIRLNDLTIKKIKQHYGNKNTYKAFGNSDRSRIQRIIELAMVDLLTKDTSLFTRALTPLTSFVGCKTEDMQTINKEVVDRICMTENITEIQDICVGAGNLFFTLDTTNFVACLLNDASPSRFNLLNIIKTDPVKLADKFFKELKNFEPYTPALRREIANECNRRIEAYDKQQKKYVKTRADVQIAYDLLVFEILNNKYIPHHEKFEKIQKLPFKIMPFHLKLKNVTITNLDARCYLQNNNTNRLVIVDGPYPRL